MGNKKMGRPTDSLKDKEIKIRIDQDSLNKLQYYSEKMNVSRSEAIRRLIRKAYEDIQNK